MELTEVDTPLLCIPRLLVPKGWVVDVHSHHVPLSIIGGCRHVDSNVGHDVSHTTSYNVAILQPHDSSCGCMYYTELFLRRGNDEDVSAEAMHAALESIANSSHESERSSRQVWVKEITAALSSNLSKSEVSIASLLLPTHRVFIQIVCDVASSCTADTSPSSAAAAAIVTRIMDAAVAEYIQHRSSVSLNRNELATQGNPVDGHPDSDTTHTLARPVKNVERTESCPVAPRGGDGDKAAWKRYTWSMCRNEDGTHVLACAALRTIHGGCLIELDTNHTVADESVPCSSGSIERPCSMADARWRIGSAANSDTAYNDAEESMMSSDLTADTDRGCWACTQDESAQSERELRRIARDELGLDLEPLLLTQPGNGLHTAQDQQRRHFVFATLPLTGSRCTSVHHYVSMEALLESRMQAADRWDFVKLWTSPRTASHSHCSAETAAAAAAASDTTAEQMQHASSALLQCSGACDGTSSARERHTSSATSLLLPRRTLYALRSRCRQGCVEARSDATGVVYLVMLCAPRILGKGAVVILTATTITAKRSMEHTSADGLESRNDKDEQSGTSCCDETDGNGNKSDANCRVSRNFAASSAQQSCANGAFAALQLPHWHDAARLAGLRLLPSQLTVTLPHTRRWSSLSWAVPIGPMGNVPKSNSCNLGPDSRVLVRQGRLVLSLGAPDAGFDIYAYPTAAQCFTTLGSLTVVEEARGQHRASETVSCRKIAAVWSLLETGRSASEYMDYVYKEYSYTHTGATLHARCRTRSRLSSSSSPLSASPAAFTSLGGGAVAAVPRRGMHEQQQQQKQKQKQQGHSDAETCAMWMDVRGSGAHARRMYVRARELGIGILLLVQTALPASSRIGNRADATSTIAAPSAVSAVSEKACSADTTRDGAMSGQTEDEQELMTWVDGIEVSTV